LWNQLKIAIWNLIREGFERFQKNAWIFLSAVSTFTMQILHPKFYIKIVGWNFCLQRWRCSVITRIVGLAHLLSGVLGGITDFPVTCLLSKYMIIIGANVKSRNNFQWTQKLTKFFEWWTFEEILFCLVFQISQKSNICT
jgi:hypothetical protein